MSRLVVKNLSRKLGVSSTQEGAEQQLDALRMGYCVNPKEYPYVDQKHVWNRWLSIKKTSGVMRGVDYKTGRKISRRVPLFFIYSSKKPLRKFVGGIVKQTFLKLPKRRR